MDPIYLDYNATTPVDQAVLQEMMPYLDTHFGNPSSNHSFGIQARKAIHLARKRLAVAIGCEVDEIVFTSGGTESNNFAIKGVAYANQGAGNHIITSPIEHPAVLAVCSFLEKRGFNISYLGVDSFGIVDPEELESLITSQTILISVMHANNETGSIQPINDISRIARKYGILVHTDAAQSMGKIPVDVNQLGVDLLSVAGHKMYAPKGVGALFIRRGVKLEKFIHGADHESNWRAGTENVPELVGLGKAAEIIPGRNDSIEILRDRLHEGIRHAIPEIRLNGHPEHRLPNTVSLGFPGVDASLLLQAMKGIAASAGAACHAGEQAMSGVLLAMNVPPRYAMGTVRFSLGRMTTSQEITRAISRITDAYREVAGEGWIRKQVEKQVYESEYPSVTSGSLSGKFSPAVIPELTTASVKRDPESTIRLTEYTHALGCACKLRPLRLEKILAGLSDSRDPDILVGLTHSDDAAVYRITSDLAIVQTVDVIPPIVDDPYIYGMIAASNALSDIYAMGGNPLFALNIVGFPDNRLPLEILTRIIQGAEDKAREAGIEIIGGHTIEDPEPKFGLVVTGIIHPEKILRKRGIRPGDGLILTKPLGTGILTTAMKQGMVEKEIQQELIHSMTTLNRNALVLMKDLPVHAATDVTGFGLLGHLKEMVGNDQIDISLEMKAVPVFQSVWSYLAEGFIPGGTRNNLEYVQSVMIWGKGLSELEKLLLCDAQTSGGLLYAMPYANAEQHVRELKAAGIGTASLIGRCTQGIGKIYIEKE